MRKVLLFRDEGKRVFLVTVLAPRARTVTRNSFKRRFLAYVRFRNQLEPVETSRFSGFEIRSCHASPTLRTASAHGLCFRGARGRQLRLLMAPPPRKPGQSLGKVRARGGWKELRHRRRSDVGCGVCRGLLRNVRLCHPPLTVLQYLSPSTGNPPSPCMTTRHHYTVALQ